MRNVYPPHRIVAYKAGKPVGSLTMPHVDQRFVKAEELMTLAYQLVKRNESNGLNRRTTDPQEGWDRLTVWYGWMEMKCDQYGRIIYGEPDMVDQIRAVAMA